MQWRNLQKGWVSFLDDDNFVGMVGTEFKHNDHVKEAFNDLFEKYCAPALLWIKKNTKTIVEMQDIAMVQALLNNLECVLSGKITDGADKAAVTANLEPSFVFCAIWAFGSFLCEKDGVDYRKDFNSFWRDNFKSVKLPNRDMVYDYYLDPQSNSFVPWKDSPFCKLLPGLPPSPSPPHCSKFVRSWRR